MKNLTKQSLQHYCRLAIMLAAVLMLILIFAPAFGTKSDQYAKFILVYNFVFGVGNRYVEFSWIAIVPYILMIAIILMFLFRRKYVVEEIKLKKAVIDFDFLFDILSTLFLAASLVMFILLPSLASYSRTGEAVINEYYHVGFGLIISCVVCGLMLIASITTLIAGKIVALVGKPEKTEDEPK